MEKYFVAAGFAFIHPDSTTDLCAVEAVKLEELDPEAVRAGLTEYTAKLASLQVWTSIYIRRYIPRLIACLVCESNVPIRWQGTL